jgi:2-keto-3-deoxy-L-fuconate dehydrogenase
MNQSSTGRLAGKRILVTAAAMGIGKASVEAMVSQGAHVVATDRNFDALLEAFGDMPEVQTHALDVLDESAINSLISEMPAFVPVTSIRALFLTPLSAIGILVSSLTLKRNLR